MEMNTMPQAMPGQAPSGSKANKVKLVALIVLAVIILAAVATWALTGAKITGQVLGANTSGYQAVFLTNGQVYFGKLTNEGNWMQLTDIYYLQVTQNLQNTTTGDTTKDVTPSTTGTDQNSQSNIQLIKLGSELHGPQDNMYIEHDKIMFWENMKDDSKVVTAIKQYKSK
jgi:hypothetical protein